MQGELRKRFSFLLSEVDSLVKRKKEEEEEEDW